VRYTTHARTGAKIAGYAATLLAVIAAIGFNIFMAWWRADSETRDPADATGWLGLLATGPSITLMMLGGIVFLMALYEGATKFGDAYPGYGKFERHAQDAEAEFQEALDEATEELHNVADPVIEKINARVDAEQAAVARMLGDFDAAAARIADIDGKLRAIAATQLALVALYRQENVAHRTTPAPRAFLLSPTQPTEPPDVLSAAGARIEEAKASFAAVQSSANREIGDLLRALSETQARLEGRTP
jgi:hypothetical protein